MGSKYYHHDTDLDEDEDESEFVSPLKAHKKTAPIADSDLKTDSGDLEAKKKENKKTDTGNRAFHQMVEEKRATITTTNNR